MLLTSKKYVKVINSYSIALHLKKKNKRDYFANMEINSTFKISRSLTILYQVHF